MSDDFDYSAFIGQFATECREHLANMNDDLLALEEDQNNEEALAEIVRLAHTIKGAAKMMGAEDIAVLSHRLEDLLGEVKEKRLKLTDGLCDTLFASFDGLGNLLSLFAGEAATSVDAAALIKTLDGITGANGSQKSVEAESKQKAAKPSPVIKQKTTGGSVNKGQTGKKEETIRVSAKKLDDLANLTGELVINQIHQKDKEHDIRNIIETQRMMELALKSLKDTISRLRLVDQYFPELDRLETGRQALEAGLLALYRGWREDSTQMDLLVEQLKQEVLGARMVPVSTLFDTFSRPVRDLAREFKKEVELTIDGGDTELDRRMIEVINEPMIHMIRNAIDHGLEMPKEREAAGKPRQGRLNLAARHEGEYVVIEMADDGAGINLDKVREKAVKKKLINMEEAPRLNESELIQMLFKPGFSTNDIITDISGRGVGMDVVKKRVEELKGLAYLRTEKGKGTTVTLKVPLTLAMARVMFVKAGERLFAIPTMSVEETLRLRPGDIRMIEGQEAMVLREHALPLAHLSTILGLDRVETRDKRPVVIMNLADTRVGLIVDELVDEHEVVIKTLGGQLAGLRNVAGATILGNGEVVLILNPSDIIASAKGMSADVEEKRRVTAPVRKKRILLVDDSATARELEKSILISAGYLVDEAVDGVDALAKVAKKHFDLMVIDVQMPRMDGLVLTKRLKNDERYSEIPVVIVTTLEKEDDKQRGIEAGADAYIVKRAFDQANLLSVIEQLTAA